MLLLIITPVCVFATKKFIEISKMDDVEIADANQKETERALAEKEKFAQEHQNKAGSSIEVSQTYSSTEDDETIIEEEAKKVREKLTATINVIKKYYESEYNEIQRNLEKEAEENKDKLVDLKTTPLTENQKRLFNLILRIIDNEKLSSEELSLLKDYLESNKIQINNDSELKSKVDKVLE